MSRILEASSYGYTRITTGQTPKCRSYFYSKNVQDALRSMGYRVTEKKAYEWDKEKNDWSAEKPVLDYAKRETFFIEITWG